MHKESRDVWPCSSLVEMTFFYLLAPFLCHPNQRNMRSMIALFYNSFWSDSCLSIREAAVPIAIATVDVA